MESSSTPAINDIDLGRALGGAHPHITVAHEQIAAFDELDAHLLGEEHMLEIGAVVAPLGVISGHRPTDQVCPLYPRKQTFSALAYMSAKCKSGNRWMLR